MRGSADKNTPNIDGWYSRADNSSSGGAPINEHAQFDVRDPIAAWAIFLVAEKGL